MLYFVGVVQGIAHQLAKLFIGNWTPADTEYLHVVKTAFTHQAKQRGHEFAFG
jgi:hypothetical protein